MNSNYEPISSGYLISRALIKLLDGMIFTIEPVWHLENIETLNFVVLPQIIQLIKNNHLYYDGKRLNYEIEKFKINKFLNYHHQILEIEMKYFNYKFVLKINLKLDFTTKEIKNLLKDLHLENKVLTWNQWESIETIKNNLTKSFHQWLSELNNEQDDQQDDRKIELEKCVILAIDIIKLDDQKQVEVYFKYGNSSIENWSFQYEIKITNCDLIANLEQKITAIDWTNFEKTLLIDLKTDNVVVLKMLEKIKTTLDKNIITINQTSITIIGDNFFLDDFAIRNQDLEHDHIIFSLVYVIEQQTFHLSVKLFQIHQKYQIFKQLSTYLTAWTKVDPFDVNMIVDQTIYDHIVKQLKTDFYQKHQPNLESFENIEWTIMGGNVPNQNAALISTDHFIFVQIKLFDCWKIVKVYLQNIRKNPEQYFEEIIATIKAFKNNNFVDLTGLTSDDLWTTALEKMKKLFIQDPDFARIIFEINAEKQYLKESLCDLKNEFFENITIKLDQYHYTLCIGFKNVEKTTQYKFDKVLEQLLIFNSCTNGFKLQNINTENNWQAVLNQLTDHFSDQPYFSLIQWAVEQPLTLIKNLNYSKPCGWNNFSIKLGNDHEAKIELFFCKIDKSPNHYMNDITKQLQQFDCENRFDLAQLGANKTWADVLTMVKNYFSNNDDFSDVDWKIKNNDSRIYHQNTDDGMSQQELTFCYKSLCQIKIMFFKNIRNASPLAFALEKLKPYTGWTPQEYFDISGLRGDNTYDDAIERIKDHFKDDEDFKPQFVYETFSKGVKIKNGGTVKGNTTYINLHVKLAEELSGWMLFNFTNFSTKTFFEHAFEKLHYYENNAFDLNWISSEKTWNDVLEYLKTAFNHDNDFQAIDWSIDQAATKLIDDVNFGQAMSQTIHISKDHETPKSLKMMFKNIWNQNCC